MKFQICILAALVAATSAKYNPMPHGSYSNGYMDSTGAHSTPAEKSFPNYQMDNVNMYSHNLGGTYQHYMPMPGRMSAERDVYPGYSKYSSNPHMMSMMPSGLNVRYTSTPTTSVQQGGQPYVEMGDHQNALVSPSYPNFYSNGAEMPYNHQYRMRMSGAAQGYAGYAHSSMMKGEASVRPIMSSYQGSDGGHMMMMNGGHYSHQMPSSYVSFNGGSGANYRW